ncbi:MAG TPA: UvrD-helicase domain-containing protein [Acidimicrobiia bacterium]|nr:UvrD-helicase domain-containing protein [Acidimicrobiia bacterium]
MPDHADPELAAEQAYVTAAYARLEAMRAAAERVRTAYADVRAGGTHQARLERDIAWDVTQRRLADLEIGESPLVFGRLDLERGVRWYVGRLAVEDEGHTPLVVDWRAPVAEPFYRATAVEPMAVVRRRHLITRKGREVTGLDDEVFDQEAVEDEGLGVAGEGALLAALERNRTGRMGDIVATIQAEQDEAIRADVHGVLVVGGGPGTGKTAVALHRAAYLLYTHRRRLANQGVLLIGPSPVFLRYIEQVLPSLGEQDVQLSTISGLKPRIRVVATDTRPTAALKGGARMARVIQKAVTDRERPLARDLIVLIDGLRVRLSRSDTARVIEGTRRRRNTHNENRQYVARRLYDLLVARYKNAAIRAYRERGIDSRSDNVTSIFDRDSAVDASIASTLARGEPTPEGWEQEMRVRFRGRPEVKEALERIWPVLSGAELVNDLFGFRALVRSASGTLLSDDEQELLHRRRDADFTRAPWTEADLALVDEADSLLGPVEAARPVARRRNGGGDTFDTAERVIDDLGLRGYADAATLATRFGDGAANNGNGHEVSFEPRTFGHVLVDEAQDLTAMQWRMLARRCPSGSMTLVGDPGQASKPGAVASWDDVLSHLPTHNATRHVSLSINYRTPAEVMEVASRLLAVAAPTVEPSRSVRSTGEYPRFIDAGVDDLVAITNEQARAALGRTGAVAVIAPPALHDAIVASLADVGAVATSADALDAPIAVLDPTSAKGLEFDHVIVVEPAQLVQADQAGLRLLYVTITRTTKTLTVVHAEALPEGLTPRLD